MQSIQSYFFKKALMHSDEPPHSIVAPPILSPDSRKKAAVSVAGWVVLHASIALREVNFETIMCSLEATGSAKRLVERARAIADFYSISDSELEQKYLEVSSQYSWIENTEWMKNDFLQLLNGGKYNEASKFAKKHGLAVWERQAKAMLETVQYWRQKFMPEI